MFNCSVCAETIGPRIKPITVVLTTRPTSYHNEYFVLDDYDKPVKRVVDSVGTEIVTEEQVCVKCSVEAHGLPEATPKPALKPTVQFEELMAAPMHVSFAAAMVHTTLDKINSKQKRLVRDCELAVPLIKRFVDANPKFIF